MPIRNERCPRTGVASLQYSLWMEQRELTVEAGASAQDSFWRCRHESGKADRQHCCLLTQGVSDPFVDSLCLWIGASESGVHHPQRCANVADPPFQRVVGMPAKQAPCSVSTDDTVRPGKFSLGLSKQTSARIRYTVPGIARGDNLCSRCREPCFKGAR